MRAVKHDISEKHGMNLAQQTAKKIGKSSLQMSVADQTRPLMMTTM